MNSADHSASIPRAALVTGGAKRLGRAIALALADAGFAVAVHCHRSTAEAEATCERHSRPGVGLACSPADLADEAAVARLVPAQRRRSGRSACWSTTPARSSATSGTARRARAGTRHLEPNLRAPFVLIQHFARALPAGAEGVVVNMLDQRVWSLTPHFVSYTVAKAGAVGADAEHGAGAGAAHPGQRHRPRPGAAERAADRRAVRPAIRLGPAGPRHQPDEVARAVLAILALPSMTGQMIALDGGQHLQWHPRRGQPPLEEEDRHGRTHRRRCPRAAPRVPARHGAARPASASIRTSTRPQRVRINVDLGVRGRRRAVALSRAGVGRDELSRVVDYERIANSGARDRRAGHVRLVETLAERIAEACLLDRGCTSRDPGREARRFRRRGVGGRGNRAPADGICPPAEAQLQQLQ